MNEEIELNRRYQQVLEEIEQTTVQAGRNPAEIGLVVVTKSHSASEIEALYHLGARQIGENRTVEALKKQAQLSKFADLNFHFIGHIQSRKAADVAGKFALVHSLDSVKLARRMDRFAAESGTVQEVLLQFNTSGEMTKSGFSALDGTLTPEIEASIEHLLNCNSLIIRGLMTMAPWGIDPEIARPAFADLRRLKDNLAVKYPQADWSQLSMGMSSDYKVAIQEGATLLRIGTAIMGRSKI